MAVCNCGILLITSKIDFDEKKCFPQPLSFLLALTLGGQGGEDRVHRALLLYLVSSEEGRDQVALCLCTVLL